MFRSAFISNGKASKQISAMGVLRGAADTSVARSLEQNCFLQSQNEVLNHSRRGAVVLLLPEPFVEMGAGRRPWNPRGNSARREPEVVEGKRVAKERAKKGPQSDDRRRCMKDS